MLVLLDLFCIESIKETDIAGNCSRMLRILAGIKQQISLVISLTYGASSLPYRNVSRRPCTIGMKSRITSFFSSFSSVCITSLSKLRMMWKYLGTM